MARALWEISKSAVIKNVKEIARYSGKKIIAVVKANAYGHGVNLIAPLLERLKELEFFAVSCAEEGVALRLLGIKKPILLLSGFLKEELELLKKYKLIPVVSTEGELKEVIRRKIPYHLNIDTGMGRLGLLRPPYGLLKIFPPQGVMTHFSQADLDPDYTRKQIGIFKKLIRPLRVKYIHLQNSAGLSYKVDYANLVRVGLSIYGEFLGTPPQGLNLTFPSRIRAKIVGVRRLPKGRCISYGCTYRLKKPSFVGVIALGYADGLKRCLSNRLKVLYKGRFYPLAGSITMDLTAVVFSDTKPSAGEWVEVVFEGQRFGDLARLCKTVPYEMMTSVGNRVKRSLI
ncbi:MAG TPA: alanine racemase [Aquifex aeolicus]|uniref:Alanine racemase n=1 Tax=Aquifex aeolicus TaxID=63363 RepID=A0A9D0YPJ1_AQUAO|nr:alanine racemase [Aquifex aeolicus]